MKTGWKIFVALLLALAAPPLGQAQEDAADDAVETVEKLQALEPNAADTAALG